MPNLPVPAVLTANAIYYKSISPTYTAFSRGRSHFVAYLHKEGIAPGTVKSYLAALRHSRIALGLGDPHMGGMVQLEYVIKGLKRVSGPQASRTRLPITPAILRKLGKAWDGLLSPFDASMLWAAALMCFFGFLRSGEVVIPTDSAFDPTTHLA